MRRGRRLTAAVAVLMAVGGWPAPAAAGPSTDDLRRDLDALRASGITGVLARIETPAGTRVVTAGVADTRTGRPVPADPYIRIGSTTKTFVAVVVLQLVGDLLRHTSGIHDHTSELIWNYATPELYRQNRWRVYTPAELVAVSMRHPPGGREHSYSNTNYVLAGMLVEAVTGHDWQREVRDRILTPLRLRRTFDPELATARQALVRATIDRALCR